MWGAAWTPDFPTRYLTMLQFRQNGLSAFGTKRKYLVAPHMSDFGGKADMPFCTANVCF